MTNEQFQEFMDKLDEQGGRIVLMEKELSTQSATLDTIQIAQRDNREHNNVMEMFCRHLQFDYKAAIASDAQETRQVAREAGRIIERIYAEWLKSRTINGELSELIALLRFLVGPMPVGAVKESGGV